MNKKSRRNLFNLFLAASRYESRLRRADGHAENGFLIRNYFWLFQVCPVLVAMLFEFIGVIFASPKALPYIRHVALLILLVSYVSAFTYPFVMAWMNRNRIRRAVKYPIAMPLNNVNITTTVDARLVSHLIRHAEEDLQLLALEMKAEKDFFERRISLVIGAIDKIGLGPGFLALLINLSNAKIPGHGWVSAIAYAVMGLYVLGIAGHFLIMRLDRYVKITDLAISQRETQEFF